MIATVRYRGRTVEVEEVPSKWVPKWVPRVAPRLMIEWRLHEKPSRTPVGARKHAKKLIEVEDRMMASAEAIKS